MIGALRALGWRYVLGIALLTVVVRLAVGGLLLSHGPAAFVLASDDGDAYDAAARWQAFGEPIAMTERMAQKWPAEVTVSERWPQGYWLFLAGEYHLFGSAYVSTVVLQALIACGGVLAAYALARQVLPVGQARLAGAAVALSSTGIVLSTALYAESLYIPLLGSGLALVAAATRPSGTRRRSWLWLGLGGGAFALAEATRPLALPVAAAAALWCSLPFGSRTGGERTRMLFALSAGFLLSIAPFVARDLVASGRVTTFTVGGAEAYRDQAHDALGLELAALQADPYTSGVLGTGAAILAHPGETLYASTLSLPTRVVVLFMYGWAPLGEPFISRLGSASVWFRLAEWLLVAFGALRLMASPQRTPVSWLIGLAVAAVIAPALVLGLPLVRYRAAADALFIVYMVAGLAAPRHVGQGSAACTSGR